MIKHLDLALEKIEELLVAISILMIFFLVFAINYDVAGRNLHLGWSAPWTVELSKLMVLSFAFFVSPWIFRHKGHVTFEMVINVMPAKVKRFMHLLGTVVSLLAFLVLAYYSCMLMIDAIQRGIDVINILRIPRWLFFFPIFLGSVLTVYELIKSLFEPSLYNG